MEDYLESLSPEMKERYLEHQKPKVREKTWLGVDTFTYSFVKKVALLYTCIYLL